MKKQSYFIAGFFGNLLGAFFGAFSFATKFHLNFMDIIIRPSHLMVWAIWLLSIVVFTWAQKKQMPGMTFFISSASIAVVMAYMTNNGRFMGPAFNSVLPLLSGFLFSTLFLLSRRSDTEPKYYSKPSIGSFIIWIVLILGVLLVVRGGNIVMRHLPNEERSLMIAGIEFHHFLTGLCIIAVSLVLLLKAGRKGIIQFILGCIIVAGLTLTADQLTYMMMYPLSDDAFFSLFSFGGAIVCSLFLAFCLARKVFTQ